MDWLKQIISSSWSLSRIIRLVLGAFFIGEAYSTSAWPIAAVGVVLVYQALANVGCANGCVQETKKHPHDITHNFKYR